MGGVPIKNRVNSRIREEGGIAALGPTGYEAQEEKMSSRAGVAWAIAPSRSSLF
jgi:hypothetical protein